MKNFGKKSGVHKLRIGFKEHYKNVRVKTPRGEPIPWDANSKLKIVGQKVPRIDGPPKVTGEAKYTFDQQLPGMLYAAVLRCPHPCAIVSRLDIESAKKNPEVRATIALAKTGDRCIFAGQDIAAVAATSLVEARRALQAIVVEYQVEPSSIDLLKAMDANAPLVHKSAVQERRTEGDEPISQDDSKRPAQAPQGNTRPGRSMKKGKVKRGLKLADIMHEATYRTAVQTHSALEAHGILVRWDATDSMTVWASTQSIFSVREEMARIFGLEDNKVRVITEYMGGGFGAKFGANAPGSAIGKIAGTLAKEANAPVKLTLDRSEEHLVGGNRPNAIQSVQIGASTDGRLLGIHVQAHGTAGIATGAGVGSNAFGIYSQCPHILVESRDVFTHAGPGTSFRAPGHPQGAFAIESALDELARKSNIDPVDIRVKNDGHPLRRYQLEIGRKRFEWDKRKQRSSDLRQRNTRIRRGVGVASSIWGDYSHPGVSVTVTLSRDGTVELRNGVQDIGGGIGTAMAMIAGEVLRRPLSKIQVRIGDSQFGAGVGSGGSKTTSSVTPAVRNACESIHNRLKKIAAREFGIRSPDKLIWDEQGNVSFGRRTLGFVELCKRMDGEVLVATETRPETYASHPHAYPGSSVPQLAGVQFAEVEVDTWTGKVKCTHLLAIHDCGRVVNELTVRSQINGGIIGGLSYAIMEQRIMDNDLGVQLNPNYEQYKIAGAMDIPDIDILLTEVATGSNSTGALGIGEPATIPTAAAIANATADAIGAQPRDLPLTPAIVLDTLRRSHEKG